MKLSQQDSRPVPGVLRCLCLAALLLSCLSPAAAGRKEPAPPVCSVQDWQPGHGPPIPESEFEVLRRKLPGNCFRIVQESRDKSLRVEYDLIRFSEDILEKKESAAGTIYLWKGRALPKYFSPACSLLPTNVRLVWKSKVYDLPREMFSDMTFPMPAEFVAEPGSKTKRRLGFTSDNDKEIRQKISASDSLELSAGESRDGRSTMLELETHGCCCVGDYTRWIVDASGAVLRHRLAWGEGQLYDDKEQEMASPFDETGVLLAAAFDGAPQPGPREGKVPGRQRLLRVPCYGPGIGISVLLDLVPAAKVIQLRTGGYASGRRKLPAMFSQGDAVVRKIEILWNGRRQVLPKRLSEDICMPEKFTVGPDPGDPWGENYGDCDTRPQGYVSHDGATVMLAWRNSAENGGAVRWIIGRDGKVLRHIGPAEEPEI